MSYCRWSSMDSMCDLYVYHSTDGSWTGMVAKRRRVFTPTEPYISLVEDAGKRSVSGKQWEERNLAYHEAMEAADWKDLPEPSTGGTFHRATPGEMADTLETLRKEGFNVPDYAIESLREEQADLDKEAGNG